MHETQKYNRKVGKRHYVEIFLEADIEMLSENTDKFESVSIEEELIFKYYETVNGDGGKYHG